ncbi:MAG: cupin domain-containing protein [Oscillospiraceae bacterium]|jgi:uncharacterized cupin superfamily protein|nr:cupin domain-containing protein [Oscillospiraceae bacterium]
MIEKVFVTKKEKIKPKHVGSHPAYEYDKFEVSPRNGGNQCAVTFYDIAPGKSNYPLHSHSGSEEIFYIISGHGTVETGGGEMPVSAGSVMICPAGEGGTHRITNQSDSEVLTYIDIDTVPKTDMCVYPESGKVGILTNDGFAKFYKANDNVMYYEGE